MAALTATRGTPTGATATPGAVAASDTISSSQLGQYGADLIIFNGGASPDTVAISDAGKTPAGNAGSTSGGSVTNGTNKTFHISRQAVDPTTGLVTVTHTYTTTVTYLLIPLG
jgi:hypothetical protein